MDKIAFNFEKYPEEIAAHLYELAGDMDAQDYEETKGEEIEQLTKALENIQAICQNEYNQDYWRTFYKALENI